MTKMRRAVVTIAKCGAIWFLGTTALLAASMMGRGWGMPSDLFLPEWVPGIAQLYVYFGAISGALAAAAIGTIGGAGLLLRASAAREAHRVKMWTAHIEERAPGQLALANDEDRAGQLGITDRT